MTTDVVSGSLSLSLPLPCRRVPHTIDARVQRTLVTIFVPYQINAQRCTMEIYNGKIKSSSDRNYV
jgi:hypothetical protein